VPTGFGQAGSAKEGQDQMVSDEMPVDAQDNQNRKRQRRP
jgi:hypothetical protein